MIKTFENYKKWNMGTLWRYQDQLKDKWAN